MLQKLKKVIKNCDTCKHGSMMGRYTEVNNWCELNDNDVSQYGTYCCEEYNFFDRREKEL